VRVHRRYHKSMLLDHILRKPAQKLTALYDLISPFYIVFSLTSIPPQRSCPTRFYNQIFAYISCFPCACYMPLPPDISWLNQTKIGEYSFFCQKYFTYL
jgi:hypothetical protein